MKRRQTLALGGVALAATAAGVGWSIHEAGPGERAEPAEPWSRRFTTPDGGELALAALRGRPLLLNFWATWCPPCVREMPLLDDFHRRWSPQGWQVVGVAVDQLAPVQAFLQRTPVGFPVALSGFDGVELSRKLGNDGGGLPFTVVFGSDGRAAARHAGETDAAMLEDWARMVR